MLSLYISYDLISLMSFQHLCKDPAACQRIFFGMVCIFMRYIQIFCDSRKAVVFQLRDMHRKLSGIHKPEIRLYSQPVQCPAEKTEIKCCHMTTDHGLSGRRITKEFQKLRIDILLCWCHMQHLIRDVIERRYFRWNAYPGIHIALIRRSRRAVLIHPRWRSRNSRR